MGRVSASVLAIACFLVGYAVAGYRTSASADDIQIRRLPNSVNVGDTVTMTFASGTVASATVASLGCKIADISGVWVRCTNDVIDTLRRHDWYDMTRVVTIQKTNK